MIQKNAALPWFLSIVVLTLLQSISPQYSHHKSPQKVSCIGMLLPQVVSIEAFEVYAYAIRGMLRPAASSLAPASVGINVGNGISRGDLCAANRTLIIFITNHSKH